MDNLSFFILKLFFPFDVNYQSGEDYRLVGTDLGEAT
jgi:hypothetical protein